MHRRKQVTVIRGDLQSPLSLANKSMITEALIKNLAEQHISGTDKFVVSIKIKPGNKIFIFIDADSHITIADCVSLSKFIESQFDRDIEDFEIEVS
ncbi:MAG: hypothetical protein HGB12_09715, partial [Bacteroidetes bacterium]|nr:hypothetical protein [Bacteroidota bacterium]